MTIEELKEFYGNKKVLITGHTGFKGSWLTRILTLSGAEVTGYSLTPPTDPSLFEIAGLEDTIKSVVGDIRDLEHLSRVFEETGRRSYFIWQPSRLCGNPIRSRFTPMKQM